MFNDAPEMGLRDVAAFCEDCNAMRVGPRTGSFLATRVMDDSHEGRFIPLLAAMVNAVGDWPGRWKP